MPKPQNHLGYNANSLELVRQLCLTVATFLGDLIENDLVIVGGLVPTLLIDQSSLSDQDEKHVGTTDLDLGLTLAMLDEKRYAELSERLRRNNFSPDSNEKGNPTLQRWRHSKYSTLIDFLIPISSQNEKPGTIMKLESDFGALVTVGLELAFIDRKVITLDGKTLDGAKATRKINVCGAGAFIVLKALAFRGRLEPKDAYDLFYVIRNYSGGPEEIASKLKPIIQFESTRKALNFLREDFSKVESLGPREVANFIGETDNLDVMQDVVGFVTRLLTLVDDL